MANEHNSNNNNNNNYRISSMFYQFLTIIIRVFPQNGLYSQTEDGSLSSFNFSIPLIFLLGCHRRKKDLKEMLHIKRLLKITLSIKTKIKLIPESSKRMKLCKISIRLLTTKIYVISLYISLKNNSLNK